jgi:phospholipase/carboxylesterase
MPVVPGRPDPRLVEGGDALACAGLVHRVLLPGAERSVPCDEPVDDQENEGGSARERGLSARPAVVMLHGRSGSEDDTWIFARTIPKDWVVVAPRGIDQDPMGGRAWVPRQRDEWPALPRFDAAADAVAVLIRALPELYEVDPRRTYLLGFSQGAATAYATMLRYPGIAQAAAGLVGFLPGLSRAALSDRPLAGLPVMMAVGKSDRFIPLSIAQDCARGLRSAGANVDYREYDVGHKVSMQGFRDLREWWLQRA